MFPSFTGSSRPRRQVNLSGRNANPFATIPGARQTNPLQLSQNALAQAQQERLLRQQERERPPAATKIQRTWRGHKDREEARSGWRREWDDLEFRDNGQIMALLNVPLSKLQSNMHIVSYDSEGTCLDQLRLLIHFFSQRHTGDILRLYIFATRYLRSSPSFPSTCPAEIWTYPLLRLTKVAIVTLREAKAFQLSRSIINVLLSLLSALSAAIPREVSIYSQSYFEALAEISSATESKASAREFDGNLLESAILGLLQPITAKTISAYEGFVSEYLVTPNLLADDGSLFRIAQSINYKLLALAVDELVSPPGQHLLHQKSRGELLRLLAYFIYIRAVAHGHSHAPTKAPDAQYVRVISALTAHLAEEIRSQIDISADSRATNPSKEMSPGDFVRNQILTLVDQENVSSLLAHLQLPPASMEDTPMAHTEASALAIYALTLLRSFPRRADEIRMWLYLGSTSRHSLKTGTTEDRLPAIKYFYRSARETKVYRLIREAPREAIDLLRLDSIKGHSTEGKFQVSPKFTAQWHLILLFLELYTFVLKVMDDEEFLSGSSLSDDNHSWTRQSALPLDEVQDLTIFLKNLAFSLYWYASEIIGAELSGKKNTIAEYFSGNISTTSEIHLDNSSTKPDTVVFAGVPGMTMAYMKGMITGLLRMVYERE